MDKNAVFNVGDWVLINRQSNKYNPHIKNIGQGARVEEVGKDCVQVKTINGGIGTVDKDSVVVVSEEKARREHVDVYPGAPRYL